MLGVLALTAQKYVACQDDFLGEFLDLAVACLEQPFEAGRRVVSDMAKGG